VIFSEILTFPFGNPRKSGTKINQVNDLVRNFKKKLVKSSSGNKSNSVPNPEIKIIFNIIAIKIASKGLS
jgi:hypothetical protein